MGEEYTENLENIEDIEKKINDLKKQKAVIRRKKRVERESKKNLGKNSHNSNTTIRVSLIFDEKINNINEKREVSGFESLSKPKITDLIVKHKLFQKIENDLINYNLMIEQ